MYVLTTQMLQAMGWTPDNAIFPGGGYFPDPANGYPHLHANLGLVGGLPVLDYLGWHTGPGGAGIVLFRRGYVAWDWVRAQQVGNQAARLAAYGLYVYSW